MISKYNRTAVLLLVIGTLIIVLAMPARRLPLLTAFGPKEWFQYLIAMFGFMGVGVGLLITSLTSKENSSSYNSFATIMILGGLYVFVMGFVLVIQPRWLDLSISGFGAIGVAMGFLYFFEVQKKFAFLRCTSPNIVKIMLLAWMIGLLICFLLYWGAPFEFWQILGHFGIDVGKGGLLKNIQNFLEKFFTYS
jgi:hypothetical protein